MKTKTVAWDDGSGDHIVLTYQGQGNGVIAVESDPNNLANARSKTIVIQTTASSPVVTKNLTVTQPACPFPIGKVENFAYTGAYQEIELPAGQYKLQCWGAQGGSNAAASSYSITAKSGGKGGYSEGIITLSQKTTVRVYVGGQGTSSAGGYNGGGSTTGSSSYSTGTSGQDGYHFGISKMGGGGGATDIRLSDGALLSRMIVAGGGSGGAMCYKKETTTETQYIEKYNENVVANESTGMSGSDSYQGVGSSWYFDVGSYILEVTSSDNYWINAFFTANTATISRSTIISRRGYVEYRVTVTSSGNGTIVARSQGQNDTLTFVLTKEEEITKNEEDTYNQTGFAGGGTTGAGYSSTYQGKQNGAGSSGSFGQGANQTTTNYRYCSGAGGGGWYGGGMSYSDSDMNACKMSGGGSGFVNTAANAGNRPSGYTGLELDSGTTVAGNTSFEAPGGGTETGHSGNGYARITRLS